MTNDTPTNRSDATLKRFKAFDVAFEAELARPAPQSFEDAIPRLRSVIDALPQRGAIKDDHATRWLDRTLKMAVDRMTLEHGEGKSSIGDVHQHVMWHIRRASGFGGSEAGTIVKHFQGEKGNFTNAHNLVMEKLLIMAPQPSTPEMARGVRAEPWVQKIYQATTGYQTDHEALSLLRGFRWDRAPFLAGTPDDFVLKDNARRRMVDYKAPSAAVCADYETKGISFDYQAQLHHYGIISMAAGSRFEDMSIEVHDPRTFEVVSYPVAFDKDLARDITSAARTLWNDYVMEGVVPDAPAVEDLDVTDDFIVTLGHEAAMFRALKEIVEEREKEWLKRITILGSEMHDKAVGKLALGVASFTRARVWDEAALVSMAEAAGIDPAAFYSDGKKVDGERVEEILNLLVTEVRDGGDPSQILQDLARDGVPMKQVFNADGLEQALREAGVDTVEAAGIKGTFGLSTKKKGPEAEAVSRLRGMVSELVDALDDVVRENAEKIIKGEEEPEVLPEP